MKYRILRKCSSVRNILHTTHCYIIHIIEYNNVIIKVYCSAYIGCKTKPHFTQVMTKPPPKYGSTEMFADRERFGEYNSE